VSNDDVSPAGNDRGTACAQVYGAAAPDYFRVGWQPLPLPPGCKQAPPSGYTGAEGKQIGSIQTIKQWARNPKGAAGNVALHLLHPFVGIDVDTYGEGEGAKNGAASLAAAEAELGPLPPTLISSARPDPLVSGIRVFRLPDGCPRLNPKAEERLTSRFGADIDVISQSYRYIVGWPSTNPEALDEDGEPRVYRWYAQHGDGSIGHPLDGVPTFAEVAELPAAWADLLAGPAGGGKDAAEAAATARAAAAGSAMADPFDPADAELDELGIDVADAATRLYAERVAMAEIDEWITKLRTTRRGRINDVLKDTISHLMHFVPHFLSDDQAVYDLVREAQRQAWVSSGKPDDGDYSAFNQTWRRTIEVFIPQQIRFGLWWVAVPMDDELPGKAGAVAPHQEVAADPTDFDEFAPVSPSRDSGSSGTRSAASGGDDADIAAMLALREQRRAERAVKEAAAAATAEAEFLAQEIKKERIRRKARRAVDEEELSAQASAEAVEAMMDELIMASKLADLDPPEWMVGGDPKGEVTNDEKGLFYRESIARVIGAGGTYKTFLMLSIASCVARGIPWFGFRTKQAPVVYVMAESARGAAARVQAFEQQHVLPPTTDLHVLTRPVHMTGEEWPVFVATCARLGAGMVVIDTQAKATTGLEENSAKDTGLWVAAAERLRRETGATVVLVHHTGHQNGGRGRGSSAAYAGVDTEIMVEPDGEKVLKYTVIRQKEGETGETGRLALVESGRSLAIAPAVAETRTEEQRERAVATVLDATEKKAQIHLRRIMMTLHRLGNGGSGMTPAALKRAYSDELIKLGELQPGKLFSAGSFTRAITELEAQGWFMRQTPRGAFVLAEAGCQALGLPYTPPAWARDDDDDLGVAESLRMAQEALDGASAGAIDGASDIEI
jgi:hypothetical protein